MFLKLILVLLIFNAVLVKSGHELLYGLYLFKTDIQPNEIAVIQFDTRPIDNYWNVSARWNQAYCDKHKHHHYFLTSNVPCEYGVHQLADPWCKVKAMVAVNTMPLHPDVKCILFIDSDSVITTNYSMSSILAYIQRDLGWDRASRPVAFNQDGPGWSCKHAFANGYNLCLNSGAVLWMKGDPRATEVLEAWWRSAGEAYGLRNKFSTRWRLKWPWEQAQQYEIYAQFRDRIQILSFPSQPFMPWPSTKNPKAQYPSDTIEPWCLSHWPGANCFITHHCSSKMQKKKLMAHYDLPDLQIPVTTISIDGVI